MNKTVGISCAVGAAFIYGFAPLLAKIAYMDGCNTITLTFFRSLISFPVMFAILKTKKIPIKVSRKDFFTLIILSFLGAFATGLMLYGAYNYISVGLTTCIHYVYPVLVALVCVLFFKEKISMTKLAAMGLSIIGLLSFLEGDLQVNFIGIALALGSGIAYAAFLVVMDKTEIKHLHPFLISFYCASVASVCLFIFGTATNQIVYHIAPRGWVLMFVMAMGVSVIANSITPIAVKNVGPTVTAILGMFEPIISVILGILFLKEAFTFRSVVGCILVILSVVMLTLERDKTNEKLE
ncbi:DMT family transporter [Sinanaerobacter sp. ZZT-01]|uniref:DMT family transporter n=1 Tax=Sinanaerobacter sp. ZZT-01 TaxID=3111540 RepID=UPI002D784813|nr:DMT family transporter [Sinanaerobacter sp. ZZT-01]WRR94551.1 DMT family transporter [Sinanaerobacter sp. ZZT-01]